MDPLDSDLIVYEQCVYLSSTQGLPRVDHVLKRQDLVAVIEYRLEEDYKNRRVEYTDQSKQDSQDYKDIKDLDQRKEREVDRALAKSKSVSFNDLMTISGVWRIILACTLCAFNE